MTRTLVTGAGGAAGVAVLRALRAAGHHTIAVDADPDAVGLRLASEQATIPRSSDPRFADALLHVVDTTQPAALVTTVAEEIAALHELTDALDARNIGIWLPPTAAVAVCLDKWKFARVLTDAGIATPATGLGDAAGIPGPWIVKPRFGRGSRDVYDVEDPTELTWACRRTPEPIVQTAAPGAEFTADLLVDRDGRVVACVPRWRLETKAGISTKGETFKDATLDAVVARTVAAVGLQGALNLQGFVHDGATTVVEINPRFSGGLPLSLAAGADLVGEHLRGTLGQPIRIERLQARAGVRMSRYFSECFES
jgi:carbamoyl-phosphate synthase large subunit